MVYSEFFKVDKHKSQWKIDIFKGEDNEFSDAVALNCAAGLIVADKEKNIKESFLKAKQHLKSGKTYEHLLKIQAI